MGASPPDPGTATPEQPTTQRYHVVKSGETLWSIARQYQLSVEQLKTMNRLYNDVIVPGVALRVE
jgi:membrane-bound lytic murein transglycosylase D